MADPLATKYLQQSLGDCYGQPPAFGGFLFCNFCGEWSQIFLILSRGMKGDKGAPGAGRVNPWRLGVTGDLRILKYHSCLIYSLTAVGICVDPSHAQRGLKNRSRNMRQNGNGDTAWGQLAAWAAESLEDYSENSQPFWNLQCDSLPV